MTKEGKSGGEKHEEKKIGKFFTGMKTTRGKIKPETEALLAAEESSLKTIFKNESPEHSLGLIADHPKQSITCGVWQALSS